jgi:hypothetical protein
MVKAFIRIAAAGLLTMHPGPAAAQQLAAAAPAWLQSWLSEPLPGHPAAQPAVAAVAKPAATPVRSANHSGPDWLTDWLSGPLPGRRPSSRARPPRGAGAIGQTVPWPKAYTPPPRPFRPAFDPTPAPPPSLKPKPGRHATLLPDLELSAGVVWTSGVTTWNHDGTSASSALGNPSSELTYEDVDAAVLEFGAKMKFGRGWFARGTAGFGLAEIGTGNFRDDDFLAGQVLFSSTDSPIPETDLFYISADVGRTFVRTADDRLSLSLFAGFQYWHEEYSAYGLYNRLTNTQTQSDDTLVLTNSVEWSSVRLGALASYRPSARLQWTADVAFIPYSAMHNEDSHWLRTGASQLGPAPNVIMDGDGFGFQGQLGLEYFLTPRLAMNLDFRYWSLMSDGEITTGVSTSSPSTFPLNDLDTTRYGVQMGVTYAL